MKIRSATFFHEPRSGKESGKETVFSLSAMLAKNKGQPPIKRTVLFYKTLFYGVNKSRYSIFLLRSMEEMCIRDRCTARAHNRKNI